MLIISYDISNDKLRTRFAKMLSKYGGRMQYSMFRIKNSDRVLDNVTIEIKSKFEKKFGQSDSVIIMRLSKQCKIDRFGYAKNDDEDLIVI
ncbi:MAG: CRISPR-associated endonuclease Cas2 [Campylobacterales bacterium]|nr:CRISPR-associated endonuclease Cas2 [Campylobacterales bacterium]